MAYDALISGKQAKHNPSVNKSAPIMSYFLNRTPCAMISDPLRDIGRVVVESSERPINDPVGDQTRRVCSSGVHDGIFMLSIASPHCTCCPGHRIWEQSEGQAATFLLRKRLRYGLSENCLGSSRSQIANLGSSSCSVFYVPGVALRWALLYLGTPGALL